MVKKLERAEKAWRPTFAVLRSRFHRSKELLVRNGAVRPDILDFVARVVVTPAQIPHPP
jgi:hypothetical protein